MVLLVLSFRRFPAFLAILIGTLIGGLVAVVLQPELVLAFVNDPTLSTPVALLKGVWSAMATGFTLDSGYPPIDTLFSGGGMSSMLYTVWLILGAMAFGAITEYAQFSRRLIDPLLARARSTGRADRQRDGNGHRAEHLRRRSVRGDHPAGADVPG